MKNCTKVPLFAVLLAITSGAVVAAEFGTRDQAKAMLDRAVAMLEADKGRALDLFTSGHGGFKNKDLYVFCMGRDGMLTAHPYFMGYNLRQWKDSTGKAIGEEIYAVAKQGELSEVLYKAPRPAGGKTGVSAEEGDQVDKVSFVTKVEDQICGVGYYK
jgi:hypothetical protein